MNMLKGVAGVLAGGAAAAGLWLATETGGTETCLGCRLDREVTKHGPITLVDSVAPNECSGWVASIVPGHRHAWRPVGCWRVRRAGYRCLVSHRLLQVPASQWLHHLQALTVSEVSEQIAMAQDLDDLDTLLAMLPAPEDRR